MQKYFKTLLDLERDSQFSTRVIILSIPSALLFIMLAILDLLSPWYAFTCYVITIIFNMFSLLPISYELQGLRRYIYALANNEPKDINFSEKDTMEIAEAINLVHKLWTSKTDTLEAQAMSDAAVFDTLPDPILMLDGEGNITGSNLAARQLLGSDIISRNIDTVFSTNILISSVEKILKNKSPSESLVFQAPQYNNRRLYAHITKLPETSKGRAVAVISLYDISKALSLEKMQSDFVANASHELRTPLSVISGFIETLQTSAKDDEDARDAFLGIMKEQAEYMSSLIEDLLSLSRLEMAQDKELKDKVDIHEVIDDVINALKIKAFQHSVNIKIDELNRIPKIIGDNQQIHQILQNLLDNAIKYANENSEVTIELKTVPEIPARPGQNVAQGKAVSIAINNKGQKINKEDLARLTEKFYRMQIHKDMKIRGTGLGLAIAKQIIMHHRGNLTVTSTTYKGNTFTVYLPTKQK
ncbi:MAG: ATP-binding protein [Alphaproteobacteria bacterium]